MKNIKILFLLLIVLIVGSCSLEEDPLGIITPNQFFQNKTEIEQFIYGAYMPLNQYDFYGSSWGFNSEPINDQVTCRENLRITYTYQFDHDLGSPLLWRQIFCGVNSANVLINGINACPSLNDETKIPYIAEARFLRGLYYFHAVIAYGNVPLMLEDTPFTVAANMGRADTSLVWDQIVSDMTYAAANGVDNFGKVKSRGTKWSALALLSRVYLYRHQFSSAANAAKMVMESGKYGLMTNFGDVFLLKNEQGIEVVFSIEFMTNVYTNSNSSSFTPRPDQEPSTTPGVVWNGWGSNRPGSRLPGMFEPGDLRKDQTVVDKNWLDANKPFVTNHWNFGPKFWNFDNPRGTSAKDCLVMRYAEVLLNYAEAENEAHGPTNAYDALNQVRTRAGLAPLGGLTKEQFREAVRHERSVELVGEFQRRWDLVRWGIWLSTMKSLPDFDLPTASRDNITDRFLLLPVPDVEIAKNPNLLPNNLGY